MTEREEREQTQRVMGFLDELSVGVINNAIYWTKHPKVEVSIRGLCTRLEEYCERGGRNRLRLETIDGCVVHDGRPLLGASLSSPRILRRIEELACGGLEFDRGCRFREFASLLRILSERPGKLESSRETNSVLGRLGCRGIRFLEPRQNGARRPPGTEEGPPGITPEGDRLGGAIRLDVPLRLYQGLVDTLQSTMMDLCCGNSIDLSAVDSLVADVLKVLDEDAKAMLNLARYEEYDAYTFGHSIRVCTLALNFTRRLTSDAASLRRIGVASLLHDVGKARLPFDLLHSQAVFGPDERREMQKHTIYGAEMLLDMADCDPMAVAAAFGHHRCEDGGGYPRTGVAMPLSPATRILKICDVYEALTSVRPYKPSVPPANAYRIMLSMNGHFEPRLLRRFIEVNGLYPVGTRVRLSTGETARVEEQTQRLELPVVAIDTTREGDPLDAPDRVLVDLSQQPSPPSLTVASAVAAS